MQWLFLELDRAATVLPSESQYVWPKNFFYRFIGGRFELQLLCNKCIKSEYRI
jgi:hypothetical protein